MSATVTYHELPPLNSWAPNGGEQQPISSQEGGLSNEVVPMFGQLDPSDQLLSSPSSSNWNLFGSPLNQASPDAMLGVGHQLGDTPVWGLFPCVPAPPPYAVPTVSAAGGDFYRNSPDFERKLKSSGKSVPNNLDLAGFSGQFGQQSLSLPVTPTVTSTSVIGGPQTAEELCLVCGDKASGYHYNALTCEGCKGFFRRSITRKAIYYCKYGGHCDIDMYMRRKCQCCRLRKCMDIGMRPERLRPDSSRLPSLVVIPEEQCRIKREAKLGLRTPNTGGRPGPAPATVAKVVERKPSCSPQQVTSTGGPETGPGSGTAIRASLTAEQQELVNRLVLFQDQFDMPDDEALTKLTIFSKLEGQEKTEPPALESGEHFQHLAELTILNVQLIMDFTKCLPGFVTLDPEDQRLLQKACATEVLMLRTARRYDARTDTIILGNGRWKWPYSRQAYRDAGIGQLTDAIFDFAKSMAKMAVDKAEYALLTAIAIFSERVGLREARRVDDIQEVYTSALLSYMEMQRPTNRTTFARLLMKLTDLRTLGNEQADALCGLKFERDNSVARLVGDRNSGPPPPLIPAPNPNRAPNVRIKVEPIDRPRAQNKGPPTMEATLTELG